MTHQSSTQPNMFIAGLVIGAAGALLFAPRRGSEMRDDIKRRVDAVKSKAKEIKQEVKDSDVPDLDAY